MKILHLSKFSIFMIVILIVAFTSFGIVISSSPSSVSNQNERIHLHTTFLDSNSEEYVKLTDMVPNSAGWFVYPSSFKYDYKENAYQTFILVRLPKTMGGDKNDTSSFRGYSALDPTSHCLMKYWPQDGRQRIEDPCISQPYRAIDGVSYNPGLTMIRAPTTGALPKLDLDVDAQGYLVVKPPIWTENKNGVVGIGRDVSKDEILQSSKILLNSCKNQMTWLALPVELQTGGVLIDITCKSDHLDAVYANNDYPYQIARVDVTFCNCTKTPKELGPWINSENGQLWTIGNATIYVSGTALQTDGNKIDPRYSEYNFRFIKNGFEVFFTDMGSFDDSAKEVLRDFFDDKNISDLKKMA